MKQKTVAKFLAEAAVFCFFCAHTSNAEMVPSWEFLEQELADSTSALSQLGDKSPQFKYLLTNRNVEAFVEMTAQGNPLLIRLAGIKGLKALDPQKGIECGLNIALTENVSVALGEIYDEIIKFSAKAEFNAIFTRALRTMPIRVDSGSGLNCAAGLILQLPYRSPTVLV